MFPCFGENVEKRIGHSSSRDYFLVLTFKTYCSYKTRSRQPWEGGTLKEQEKAEEGLFFPTAHYP